MPRLDYKTCRNCNRDASECGELSRSRLCVDCGTELLAANIDGIHAKAGVPWARVKFGMARALYGPEVARALWNAGVFAVSLDELDTKA